MTSKRWAGRTVTAARQHWAARLPLPCALCGRPVTRDSTWVVEHVLPRSQGGDHTSRSNQWVSHRRCSDISGGRMAAAITNGRRAVVQMQDQGARGIRGIGGPGS